MSILVTKTCKNSAYPAADNYLSHTLIILISVDHKSAKRFESVTNVEPIDIIPAISADSIKG